MRDVEFYGNNAIVDTGDVAFTFESAENPRDFKKDRVTETNQDWTESSYSLADYTVYPFGFSDDLPKEIKDIVSSNALAPGILTKKTQLIWGKGPKLYKEEFVDGEMTRTWVTDKEVQTWLDSWQAEDYILKCVVDFNHIEGVFNKFHLAKGARVGKNAIGKIEHLSSRGARLGRKTTSRVKTPSHCIVTDWGFNTADSLTDWKAYPLFDYTSPFAHSNAVLYSNMYSFCSDYYTVPDIYGALEWIKRSSAIPLILKALSKNSINLKYHIVSPNIFWEKKKTELESIAQKNKTKYKDSDLINYKRDFLLKVGKVLSGDGNTGKFWHSVKYAEIDGHKLIEHGWEIKEIKQNIKDFVMAQTKISDQANKMVSASLNVHPALGGAGETGRVNSGGEQIYALKNFLQTGIDIPEMIIMKAINYALKLNFPDKDLKMGFYHISPKKEEEVNPNERQKEIV